MVFPTMPTSQRQRSPAPLPVIFRPCDLACNGCLQVHALRVAHAAGRKRTHRRGQGLLGLRPLIPNDDAAIGHDLQPWRSRRAGNAFSAFCPSPVWISTASRSARWQAVNGQRGRVTDCANRGRGDDPKRGASSVRGSPPRSGAALGSAVAAGAGRCEKSARRRCRSGHAAGDVRRRGASGYRQRRRPPCQSRQSRCQGAAHGRCDHPCRSRCRSPPRCGRLHPRRLLRGAGALPRPLHRPRLGDARQRA